MIKIPATALAAALVFASACTNLDGGGAEIVTGPTATASQTLPVMIPNAVRYRAASYAHASGRSGSATLSVQALLDRDGNTELVVASGRVGVEGAQGDITKLQVKLMDPQANVMETLNYSRASGSTVRIRYPDLARHGQVQAQANVRGIDKRTDIVTVTERINRRPDIAILSISAPQQAAPNMPVLISATVAELNGDLGAAVDLVLYVDGVEVDRMRDVWVAEGDQVNAQFAYTFTTPGSHTMTIQAEGESVSDWDIADNAFTEPIVILNPQIPVDLHGVARVLVNEHHRRFDHLYGWTRFSTGQTYESQSHTEDYWRDEHSDISGWVFGKTLGASANLSIKLTSVGTGATQSLMNIEVRDETPSWCRYASANNGRDWASVCSTPFEVRVQGIHTSKTVTYYSENFQGYVEVLGYGNFHSVAPVVTGVDLSLTQGATWSVRLEGSNDYVMTANPTALPTLFTDYLGANAKNVPYACKDYPDPHQIQRVCLGELYKWTGVLGVISF
jgi:hypothetical protein